MVDEDVLLAEKPDRRTLAKVPDQEGVRTNVDRRRVKVDGKQDEAFPLIVHPQGMHRYL